MAKRGVGPEGTSVETGNLNQDLRRQELLGAAIRVQRELAGLTQPAAAELFGVSERTLRSWEQGAGSLWTGAPGRTVDHELMQKLRVTYKVLAMAKATRDPAALRNQYPSAPLDPVARREFFWRRNAMIQGQDPDAAVAAHQADHDERVARRAGGDSHQRGGKR